MKNKREDRSVDQTGGVQDPNLKAGDRAPWQEPRLKFIEPKLAERGSVKDLTGGFFGTFRP